MTSEILSAMQTLTRPPDGSSPLGSPSPLLAALEANRAALLERLRDDGGLEAVRRLREEAKAAAPWYGEGGEEDGAWRFVQELLLLLLALTRHLSRELRSFREAPPPPAGSAPPLPPDVLSAAQQKTLAAALQFAVRLGLRPHLAPGVGVPLGARPEEPAGEGAGPQAGPRLLVATEALLQVSQLSSLAAVLFSRHLGDVMAALCQLGHQPPRDGGTLSTEERRRCRDSLQNLLDKVYQPLVVRELLLLQGGPTAGGGPGPRPLRAPAPAWLRRLCGRLLSERLVKPDGVQAVVRAVLEGGTGGESDWRKCDAVARILVACPQQAASAEQYFQLLCPQILNLLHFRDKLTAQQFQRVATRAALSVVQERPAFAKQYLLRPLLAALRHCTNADGSGASEVDEAELSQCLDDVYKVCVVGNTPSPCLLDALEEVLPVIFTLFCFTKKNVSHLRAPCQEVLLWYLSHAEPAAARSALRRLAGLQEAPVGVAEGFRFSPGSEGGARLSRTHSCRDEDEDEQLFERLSEQQWSLQALMQLLAELKGNQLPADFFLLLLQELTSWVEGGEEEEEEEEEEPVVSAMTLLQLEHRLQGGAERRGQRLALLQVLAVMVESLEHSQLLRSTSQVVDFMVSLLQRACVGLNRGPGPGVENPVESQTLSMAMGLAATLLSGPQLSSEDYSSMSRLLPPLETLAQRHSDAFIQELASNLRAVIATHGAYRPDDLAAAAAAAAPPPRPTNPPPQAALRSEPRPPPRPLSDWLLEACDPDVPTRALALRTLTHLVQVKDPEAVRAQDKVLMLFLENLEHEDSFIYLSAIQGLAALADSYPDRILDRLLQDFQLGPSLRSSDPQRSLETRLKVGEVLMRASQAMGELTPHLGRPLLGVFLRGTRDPDPSVRASSLSNLGELCQRMDYSLGALAQELSSCLTALIKTEKEVEVRRAAVHVIVLLLRGLSDKTTQVLGDVLLDLYRALRLVSRSDPDQVAVLQAQLALEELDEVMRRFLFPQQKLEKKIVVLP
ncbi:transport and Golgi organization protein 6 homolog isoform X2 [Salarias fasciatus]|uniref:transport and Golgi organization protein 6 homolog isoform X2 n=1 Tax=Salarias fasciatus TaxID=181472 RepID=UPI001176E1A1|nr:transport and Golgi organization protein 6 homolog isoform X2 [Salarias fasciatus]